MSGKGKVFERSSWNVERNDGHSITCGFATAEKAHENAKPRGFRTQGVVVRYDETRSWIVDGDLTVDTTTIRRTVETQP